MIGQRIVWREALSRLGIRVSVVSPGASLVPIILITISSLVLLIYRRGGFGSLVGWIIIGSLGRGKIYFLGLLAVRVLVKFKSFICFANPGGKRQNRHFLAFRIASNSITMPLLREDII